MVILNDNLKVNGALFRSYRIILWHVSDRRKIFPLFLLFHFESLKLILLKLILLFEIGSLLLEINCKAIIFKIRLYEKYFGIQNHQNYKVVINFYQLVVYQSPLKKHRSNGNLN